MRGQDQTRSEAPAGLHAPQVLDLLRAEMEALASILPGVWSMAREEPDEAAVEAQFDNMPV